MRAGNNSAEPAERDRTLGYWRPPRRTSTKGAARMATCTRAASRERRQLQPIGQATRRYSPGIWVTLQSGNVGRAIAPTTTVRKWRPARASSTATPAWRRSTADADDRGGAGAPDRRGAGGAAAGGRCAAVRDGAHVIPHCRGGPAQRGESAGARGSIDRRVDCRHRDAVTRRTRCDAGATSAGAGSVAGQIARGARDGDVCAARFCVRSGGEDLRVSGREVPLSQRPVADRQRLRLRAISRDGAGLRRASTSPSVFAHARHDARAQHRLHSRTRRATSATALTRLRARIDTPDGRARYARRVATVELVFANLRLPHPFGDVAARVAACRPGFVRLRAQLDQQLAWPTSRCHECLAMSLASKFIPGRLLPQEKGAPPDAPDKSRILFQPSARRLRRALR